MDRENVVKAICICLGHGKCNDCPFCFSGKGYTTMNCRDYMLRDALALLKEQESKQVNDIAQQMFCFSGVCPSCGKMLNTTCNKNFCGECGQAVKWE